MNKPKRSLRSTLAELAAAFADAVLCAARESILELAPERPRAQPAWTERTKREGAGRAKAVRAATAPSRPKRTRSPRPPAEPHASPGGDLLITDPQALLAALETGGPSSGWEVAGEAPVRREERQEPEILRPAAAAPAPPAATFAPVLREGEVIVRRSAGGVVLRRRRA